jgi:hypothetical protein
MTATLAKTLRPDNKGRVSIGSFIEEGVSSFHAYLDKKHRLILEPLAEVPAQELWLHKNKKALNSVKKGIKQSAKRKTKSLGSFSKYKEE